MPVVMTPATLLGLRGSDDSLASRASIYEFGLFSNDPIASGGPKSVKVSIQDFRYLRVSVEPETFRKHSSLLCTSARIRLLLGILRSPDTKFELRQVFVTIPPNVVCENSVFVVIHEA